MPEPPVPGGQSAPPAPPDASDPDADAAAAPVERPPKEKPWKPLVGRAADSMFRIAFRNHIELTAVADTKASILIGINGVVIPVALGLAGRVESPGIRLATLLLVGGSLVSMIFAVLAARPRVVRRHIDLDDVRRGDAGLLFFGNFSGMDPERFRAGVRELMASPELLYDNLSVDLYALGGVLMRKYGFLRTAYVAFLAAVVLGSLVAIATVFSGAAS